MKSVSLIPSVLFFVAALIFFAVAHMPLAQQNRALGLLDMIAAAGLFVCSAAWTIMVIRHGK